MPRRLDTRDRILDAAEQLVQRRGFNGFSYADVAGDLGVTKPSLHYHFAGKADLGEALITRYASRFAAALGAIDATETTAAAKLERYARIYGDVLRDERMCLCGMLAAEYDTLPGAMQQAVVGFFDENEVWLEAVLEQGRRDGTLRFDGSPAEAARLIVSGLEGAMLVARPFRDVARFEIAASRLLTSFVPQPARNQPARNSPARKSRVSSSRRST
jgi:TetR/AcrR family transcriptional regulator, transcriptional repressor for nem operon